MKTAYVALVAGLTACAGEIDTGRESIEGGASALAAATYRFETLVASGKCLDVNGGASADGTRLQEWDCNPSGAQLFRLEPLGGDLARLVNVPTGKCADVAGAGVTDGTPLHLWTCNGTGAQSFRFVEGAGGTVTMVNPSSGKCVDVAGRNPANGTVVQIWTCNGTPAQAWLPRSTVVDPPPPPPPPPPGLPARVVAGYYPDWTEAPLRLRDVHSRYNLIYLFAARPEGGPPGTTGRVLWTPPGNGRGAATNFKADLQHVRRVQGRKVILSIGGARNGMSFPDRGKSQRFVDSIVALHGELGGFDGIDWNTFEADQAPDTAEMMWISLELKRRFPGFLVTAPPAPWNQRDKDFCAAMVRAGAMDYAAPQYYDGPGLDSPSYVVGSVDEWVGLLGASHVVVGFGIWGEPNYMNADEAVSAWNGVEARHPGIRGAFDWNIHLDEGQGWPFATRVGPLVAD